MFTSFVLPEGDPAGFSRTEWSRPPSSMKSRMGRVEKQRAESFQMKFLANLRRAFDEADPHGTGYISQSRWDKSTIREFLHDGNLSDAEFGLFFKRIDATSKGKVTWNELVHYLLKATTGSNSKKNHEAIQFIRKWPVPLQNKNQFHREMVDKILVSYKTNEYITVSSDSVRFWDAGDLSFKRMINDTTLFCCGLVFDNVSALALATTSRRLLFYDMETLTRLPVEICASPSAKTIKKMTHMQSLNILKTLKSSEMPMFNIPTALCIAENSIIDVSICPFFVGDDQGLIEVYNLSLPKRRSGTDFEINRMAKFHAHKAKITQITAINSALYASSGFDMRVVFFSYEPVKYTFQVMQVFTDNEPIVSFVYNIQQKCLATCGISRDAYIWSHGSGKKMSKLGGHYNQITNIISYTTTTKENYLLTMTNKKEFRLWDSINYRLMKEWSDPQFLRPENRYSAALFDPVKSQLIVAASQPVKWAEDASAKSDALDHRTHSHAIVGIFYAPEFQQLVSVDTMCSIKAWNVNTGTPESSHMEPITEDSSDISAATLDCKGRTLITSTFKNVVTSWNYNSGSMITELGLGVPKSPVSVIRCFSAIGRDYLVRGGWDKTIWLFVEVAVSTFELHRTFCGHTNDIRDIQPYSSGLVSGSVNGELLSWSFDTTVPIGRFVLQPDTCIESMKIIDSTLFVGDSNGILYLFNLPKFDNVDSIQAHGISVKHSLTSFEYDEKNSLFYSADTLGYVKQWSLIHNETSSSLSLKPKEIYRCHRDEIVSMALIKDGEFIATSGTDMCVRLFRTSDFSYVGYFSDETRWNLNDTNTWVNEAPFLVDENHFKKMRNLFGQTSMSVLRSLKQLPKIFANKANESQRSDKNVSAVGSTRSIPVVKNPEEPNFMDVDFHEISQTIEDYISNPPNYHPQSIINGDEPEIIHQPPLKPVPPLRLNSRPNELLNTIKSLLPSEETRLETCKKKVKMPILVQPPPKKGSRLKSARKKRGPYIESNLYATL